MRVADTRHRHPRARRSPARSACPATNPFRIATRCLPRIADGRSTIANYAPGADCASTLACLAALGAIVSRTPPPRAGEPPLVTIDGRGLRGLRAPAGAARLRQFRQHHAHAGRRRRRASLLIDPGRRSLHSRAGRCAASSRRSRRWAPRIDGGRRRSPAAHHSRRRSHRHRFRARDAQRPGEVAPCCWQACRPSGETAVTEPASTRDHTERALAAFGATVVDPIGRRRSSLEGGQRLHGPRRCACPGDISSAAFLAVAAAALPGSDVTIIDVGLNPSRAGAARRAAALRRRRSTRRSKTEWNGEPVGPPPHPPRRDCATS